MKKITPTLAILMLVFMFGNISAQQCAFDLQREKLLQDPNYVQLEQAAEQRIQNAILNGETASRNGTVYTIPVVVHVLHLGEAVGSGTNISDAQIQSSIDNLNYFYRGNSPSSPIDFEVEFALAQRDPNCGASTGINRIDASGVPGYSADGVSFQGPGADETTLKDLSRWPEDEYFNVWIVTEIDGNNGGFGFQGYANFYQGLPYEGSVMMYTVFGYDPGNTNGWGLNSNGDNSTVLHEVGHYFHLYHTFQGDDTNNDGIADACPADVTVGTDSDGCADTVPHQRETSTCPANNTCTGSPWVDNNTINNTMSYYYCTDRLTNDQKTRSRAILDAAQIVNSKGDEPPVLGFTAPSAVCSVNSPGANNFSGIMSAELNGTTYTSSTTGIDGGNLDKSVNCNGLYEIDTASSNTINVEIAPGNYHQLGIWIDWNNDGDFEDDAEQQHLSNDIVGGSVVPVVLTYPSSIPYDSFVRLRFVTDVDDRFGGVELIDSPCYSSLVYGQSEDYAIYVAPETLAIEDNDLTSLDIYSNFSTKELTIEGQLINEAKAYLYDIQGRLVYNSLLNNETTINNIDVSMLGTGIYIIKVVDGSRIKTKKVVVK
ncbi:zinc-dependent metalloprotease [Winogradskyella pulchriflava]|uniref:Zinc-dependent metalloprotease n=1 Tax=Winogradskyella pulchriflava TaxID=1110688 RepID=A0ABV6QD81_9FLAO